MGSKVRRGLGLLVVALLAFVAGVATQALSDPLTPSTGSTVLLLSLGGIAVVSALVGLVLIAWGLLLD